MYVLADATTTLSSLASLTSRMVYLSGASILTEPVLEKATKWASSESGECAVSTSYCNTRVMYYILQRCLADLVFVGVLAQMLKC